MFRNYLVTAIRSATRHKLYSLINVAGLAVALACALFIALFIRDELSYDKWIPDTQSVYRAELSLLFPGQPPIDSTTTPFVLGPALKADLPDVLAETHITPQNSTVKAGDRQFPERINCVDANFFTVIPLPLVYGNPATVLEKPDSIVLSQTSARKYFGRGVAMGRTILVDTKYPLTVTGIMRDLPHDTQLSGDVFISNISKASQLSQAAKIDWFAFSGFTYIKLVPGADRLQVEAKAQWIFARQIDAAKIVGAHISADKMVRARVVPFHDVHLTSDKLGGMTPGGSWTTIYGFEAIAILIILIACFNFTNLATARAMMRAREISLRKVMGARRAQLIRQFLGESVLTALVALVLALAAVEILLPVYDVFIGRPIVFHYLADWLLMLDVVAVAIIAGLLGGLYPAFVLSGFRPAVTLKTNASGQSGSGKLRTGLVILQFAISIGLGVVALVVFAQTTYARNFDLGFNRSNVVVAGVVDSATLKPAASVSFLHALDSDPNIVGAARSNTVPFDFSENRSNVSVSGNPTQFTVRTVDISPEFPAVYGMTLAAGRMLSRNRGTDVSNLSTTDNGIAEGTNVLIDAMAARMFGFSPKEAIGKVIKVGDHHAMIVGVLRNALFYSTRKEPIAMLYYFNPFHLDGFSIRLKSGHVAEGVAAIDRIWRQFVPTVAIKRFFLDDLFDKLFAADERLGTMFGIFVGIAIFIASLGLFGLAAFTAERLTKEIGIRKVFGAKTQDIVQLLLWQFSIPVLVANVIAWPVAYYYLHRWLESYAYRIALSPLYFVAAGTIALLIAWATVFAHALRVARANPIHALRYE